MSIVGAFLGDGQASEQCFFPKGIIVPLSCLVSFYIQMLFIYDYRPFLHFCPGSEKRTNISNLSVIETGPYPKTEGMLIRKRTQNIEEYCQITRNGIFHNVLLRNFD